MNESTDKRLPRSPLLMNHDDSALLVVDVQKKLLPLIPNEARMRWNIRRLIDGAEALAVAIAATEQYPQGLGGTSDEIAARFQDIPDKVSFSCGGCPSIFQSWRDAGRWKIAVVGIEAHVCVQQTVMDLLHDGFAVYVVVDAIAARGSLDRDTALRRMESAGATLTSTEATLFEWCDSADHPAFKQISKLIQETFDD